MPQGKMKKKEIKNLTNPKNGAKVAIKYQMACYPTHYIYKNPIFSVSNMHIYTTNNHSDSLVSFFIHSTSRN